MKLLTTYNIKCLKDGTNIYVTDGINDYILVYDYELPLFVNWRGQVDTFVSIDEWDKILDESFTPLDEKEQTYMREYAMVDADSIIDIVQNIVDNRINEYDMDEYDVEEYDWDKYLLFKLEERD